MLTLLFLLSLGAGAFAVIKYNELQRRAHVVREAHANLMAAMKKRLDLANKLVDITRGYGDHEKLTHLAIAQKEDSGAWLAAASTEVAGVVNHVVRLATQYPELKANTTYERLMSQLQQIEEGLQGKREVYNAQVREYNIRLTQLPTSLFAPALGFRSAPYFNVEDADSLENLKDFQTDDGEAVKALLSSASRRVIDTSVVVGTKALEKGRGIAEKRRAASAPAAEEQEGPA